MERNMYMKTVEEIKEELINTGCCTNIPLIYI